MTTEERWKIEGKARDDLREAKKNVAALKIEIEEHAESLNTGAGSLRHLLENPTGPGPTGMSAAQYTLNFFRAVIPAEIQNKILDFERESERLKKLERQVSEFSS